MGILEKINSNLINLNAITQSDINEIRAYYGLISKNNIQNDEIMDESGDSKTIINPNDPFRNKYINYADHIKQIQKPSDYHVKVLKDRRKIQRLNGERIVTEKKYLLLGPKDISNQLLNSNQILNELKKLNEKMGFNDNELIREIREWRNINQAPSQRYLSYNEESRFNRIVNNAINSALTQSDIYNRLVNFMITTTSGLERMELAYLNNPLHSNVNDLLSTQNAFLQRLRELDAGTAAQITTMIGENKTFLSSVMAAIEHKFEQMNSLHLSIENISKTRLGFNSELMDAIRTSQIEISNSIRNAQNLNTNLIPFENFMGDLKNLINQNTETSRSLANQILNKSTLTNEDQQKQMKEVLNLVNAGQIKQIVEGYTRFQQEQQNSLKLFIENSQSENKNALQELNNKISTLNSPKDYAENYNRLEKLILEKNSNEKEQLDQILNRLNVLQAPQTNAPNQAMENFAKMINNDLARREISDSIALNSQNKTDELMRIINNSKEDSASFRTNLSNQLKSINDKLSYNNNAFSQLLSDFNSSNSSFIDYIRQYVRDESKFMPHNLMITSSDNQPPPPPEGGTEKIIANLNNQKADYMRQFYELSQQTMSGDENLYNEIQSIKKMTYDQQQELMSLIGLRKYEEEQKQYAQLMEFYKEMQLKDVTQLERLNSIKHVMEQKQENTKEEVLNYLNRIQTQQNQSLVTMNDQIKLISSNLNIQERQSEENLKNYNNAFNQQQQEIKNFIENFKQGVRNDIDKLNDRIAYLNANIERQNNRINTKFKINKKPLPKEVVDEQETQQIDVLRKISRIESILTNIINGKRSILNDININDQQQQSNEKEEMDSIIDTSEIEKYQKNLMLKKIAEYNQICSDYKNEMIAILKSSGNDDLGKIKQRILEITKLRQNELAEISNSYGQIPISVKSMIDSVLRNLLDESMADNMVNGLDNSIAFLNNTQNIQRARELRNLFLDADSSNTNSTNLNDTVPAILPQNLIKPEIKTENEPEDLNKPDIIERKPKFTPSFLPNEMRPLIPNIELYSDLLSKGESLNSEEINYFYNLTDYANQLETDSTISASTAEQAINKFNQENERRVRSGNYNFFTNINVLAILNQYKARNENIYPGDLSNVMNILIPPNRSIINTLPIKNDLDQNTIALEENIPVDVKRKQEFEDDDDYYFDTQDEEDEKKPQIVSEYDQGYLDKIKSEDTPSLEAKEMKKELIKYPKSEPTLKNEPTEYGAGIHKIKILEPSLPIKIKLHLYSNEIPKVGEGINYYKHLLSKNKEIENKKDDNNDKIKRDFQAITNNHLRNLSNEMKGSGKYEAKEVKCEICNKPEEDPLNNKLMLLNNKDIAHKRCIEKGIGKNRQKLHVKSMVPLEDSKMKHLYEQDKLHRLLTFKHNDKINEWNEMLNSIPFNYDYIYNIIEKAETSYCFFMPSMNLIDYQILTILIGYYYYGLKEKTNNAWLKLNINIGIIKCTWNKKNKQTSLTKNMEHNFYSYNFGTLLNAFLNNSLKLEEIYFIN